MTKIPYDLKLDQKIRRILLDKIPLFVGVGNVFKHDDGIGVYIAEELKKDKENVIIAEMSIEKFIGKINNTQHDVLVIIDAISFNKEVGYVDIVPVSKILDQTSSTHNLSLKRIAEFFDKPVYILGIQPADVSAGEGFSNQIKKSANELLGLLL
ncbi:hydrogenase maturation protease [Hyphobacterium sp. CCMP332]|nr:hydrogenase maturation protease [Hyphobacterium sp. CCMP332]